MNNLILNQHPVTGWLRNRNQVIKTLYISVLAFLVYGCMYGLRKPFTVIDFGDLKYWGIDYKTILVISQVIGYALSKFIGIKVISEMKRSSRRNSIIILTGISEISLILFGITPSPFNAVFLFLNGIPLGMIWGLVFAYLEGRRTTEFMGTLLSISFILSSGFVKSTGKFVLNTINVSDFQMPWITGLIYFIPLILFTWLLDKSPAPDKDDVFMRSRRIPMDGKQRKKVFMEFASGLILLILAYTLLTVIRDLRDNFAAEIWSSINVNDRPMIFTLSELPAAVTILVIMSLVMFIRNNKLAFRINLIIIILGFFIIGSSTFALENRIIGEGFWMILLGIGIYMGYIPFNSLLFDRLIAAYRPSANAGFFIYIADSAGYLGSVGTLLYKNLHAAESDWFSFIKTSSYGLTIIGIVLMILSWILFSMKIKSIDITPCPTPENYYKSLLYRIK
jgi:hypothetical protein